MTPTCRLTNSHPSIPSTMVLVLERAVPEEARGTWTAVDETGLNTGTRAILHSQEIAFRGTQRQVAPCSSRQPPILRAREQDNSKRKVQRPTIATRTCLQASTPAAQLLQTLANTSLTLGMTPSDYQGVATTAYRLLSTALHQKVQASGLRACARRAAAEHLVVQQQRHQGTAGIQLTRV